MLESMIELLSALFLVGLGLLIGSCVVASMVAALHGVSRERPTLASSQKTLAACVPRKH